MPRPDRTTIPIAPRDLLEPPRHACRASAPQLTLVNLSQIVVGTKSTDQRNSGIPSEWLTAQLSRDRAITSSVSETFAARVEAVLPFDIDVRPRDVSAKLGSDVSSPGAVRGALLYLVKSGRASRHGEIGSYRYRRTGGAS